MNFLHIDINKSKNNALYIVLKVLLPLTMIFKMWYLAELQYNYYSGTLSGVFGRLLVYALCGAVGYVLQILAVSLSFSLLYKSKYSPCDENFNCRINKPTYTATCYFVLIIANILTGILNFIAYGEPIASSFIVVLLPTLISIISICGIVALLYLECEKGELRQLITSMAMPALILLLFLR